MIAYVSEGELPSDSVAGFGFDFEVIAEAIEHANAFHGNCANAFPVERIIDRPCGHVEESQFDFVGSDANEAPCRQCRFHESAERAEGRSVVDVNFLDWDFAREPNAQVLADPLIEVVESDTRSD